MRAVTGFMSMNFLLSFLIRHFTGNRWWGPEM